MIAILNTQENKNPDGLHHYRLKINHKFVLDFTHTRENGLAECLRRAADAVDEQGISNKEDK